MAFRIKSTSQAMGYFDNISEVWDCNWQNGRDELNRMDCMEVK